MERRQRWHGRRGERAREWGQVLPLTAVLLVALLAVAALGLDLGRLWMVRRDLQQAADAAALAAVQQLPGDPQGARQAAVDYARRNGQSPETGAVVEATTAPDGSAITVRVRRLQERTYLAGVLGIARAEVAATARAGLRSPSGADDAMPWGLKASVRAGATYGSSVTLKYDSQSADGGDFGAIGSGGASDYRQAIVSGMSVRIGDWVPVKTGNMVGPTRQGLQDRIAGTDPACDTFDEVFVRQPDGSWRFRDPRCNPWSGEGQGSKRVMLVPVVTDQASGGRKQVLELALVFFEGMVSCTGNDCRINARFVQASAGELDLPLGAYRPGSDLYTWGLLP